MVGRHPVAQIRREQQRGVAIDIYETIGHELLISFSKPITGLVSKRPQAFSFRACRERPVAQHPKPFSCDATPAAKSDRLMRSCFEEEFAV
jgi:hypothetical protein